MDAFTAIVVAAITAASGIISGLVVAYAKPFAEDRAAASKERRESRRRNLDRMWDILINPSYQERRVMRAQAAALGDTVLTSHIEDYLQEDADDESRDTALNSARIRLGELLRQTDVR